jgi:hypothetical protein
VQPKQAYKALCLGSSENITELRGSFFVPGFARFQPAVRGLGPARLTAGRDFRQFRRLEIPVLIAQSVSCVYDFIAPRCCPREGVHWERVDTMPYDNLDVVSQLGEVSLLVSLYFCRLDGCFYLRFCGRGIVKTWRSSATDFEGMTRH